MEPGIPWHFLTERTSGTNIDSRGSWRMLSVRPSVPGQDSAPLCFPPLLFALCELCSLTLPVSARGWKHLKKGKFVWKSPAAPEKQFFGHIRLQCLGTSEQNLSQNENVWDVIRNRCSQGFLAKLLLLKWSSTQEVKANKSGSFSVWQRQLYWSHIWPDISDLLCGQCAYPIQHPDVHTLRGLA